MIYLLTSAGMNVKEEVLKILPKPANKIRLAHIITASKSEKNISYMQKDKKEMLKLGFQVDDIDIEGKTENELRKLLKNKDVIYVQGGNTFYLLKCVRESGFDKVVKELVSRGKIYIGASAGSYIACPTIEQATWKHQDRNRVGVKDLIALHFVSFLITAHFKKEYKHIIKKAAARTEYPIVVLNDKQAILVKDEKYKVVGKGEKIFLNGFKETL